MTTRRAWCCCLLFALPGRAAGESTAVVFPSDDAWIRQGGRSSQPRGRKKQMMTAATRFGLVKFRTFIAFLPALRRIDQERNAADGPDQDAAQGDDLAARGDRRMERSRNDRPERAPRSSWCRSARWTCPGTRIRHRSMRTSRTSFADGWRTYRSENDGLALKAEQGETVIFGDQGERPANAAAHRGVPGVERRRGPDRSDGNDRRHGANWTDGPDWSSRNDRSKRIGQVRRAPRVPRGRRSKVRPARQGRRARRGRLGRRARQVRPGRPVLLA